MITLFYSFAYKQLRKINSFNPTAILSDFMLHKELPSVFYMSIMLIETSQQHTKQTIRTTLLTSLTDL